MTRPRPREHVLPTNPATEHPEEYRAGVDSANRLIDRYPTVVDFALSSVTEHMTAWPWVLGQASLTPADWARSAGFAHTLREYREAQADV